jgi:hypothetical protein
MGKECSEIDYSLHNLSTYSNKEVIDTIVENTSDHHPIRMVFKFEHKAYKNESKNGGYAGNSLFLSILFPLRL